MARAFAARGRGGKQSTEFFYFSPIPRLHMQKTHDIRWYPAMILVGSTKKQSYTNVEEPSVPYLEGDSYDTLSLLFFPFLKT